MDISGDYADTMREYASREYASLPPVNVIPLYFGPYAGFTSVFIQSVQNVILTIPFGFGLNFITKVTSRFFFLLAFLLGFGLEFTQYLLSLLLRYSYRIVDINDVLFNALGVLLGYGLFRLFARMYI
jgi:glycopeptide antibiotics resistance protein